MSNYKLINRVELTVSLRITSNREKKVIQTHNIQCYYFERDSLFSRLSTDVRYVLKKPSELVKEWRQDCQDMRTMIEELKQS